MPVTNVLSWFTQNYARGCLYACLEIADANSESAITFSESGLQPASEIPIHLSRITEALVPIPPTTRAPYLLFLGV